MSRIAFLLAAMAALTPVTPLGCPPEEPPPDTALPIERGTLETTAQAPEFAMVGQTVELIASATAEDGTPVYYAWLQTAGPGVAIMDADAATARFVAPSVAETATLRFMVTTRNDRGDVGRAEVVITVGSDPNYGQSEVYTGRPVADAGDDQRALPGASVTLDGSRSRGNGLTYRWRQVSGENVLLVDAETVRASFIAPGFDPKGGNVLLFELAVTDAENRTVTDRTQVEIRDPSYEPPRVRVETNMGGFEIELYEEDAPLSTANFLEYVDDAFYDGTLFHRVVPGFVIQGGGYLPGLIEKEVRDPIVNEAKNGLKNNRGTVAMARMNDPDSATAQWYVNLVDNDALNYSSGTPGYAVFGYVTKGMDVVDAIAAVETETREGFQNVPVVDVVILSVTRIE